MRVLIIEDDNATAKSLELMLVSAGFKVFRTSSGEEGLSLGRRYEYDTIILDLRLPDMSGYQVLGALRRAKVKTPVIVVSGLTDIDNKVKALNMGADDYVTKPFHRDELVARLHAVIRRYEGHAQSIIKVGSLSVNLNTRTVDVDEHRVKLTGKEYQMLELLALRRSLVTKEMFLDHLYGGRDEPEIKIIDVFICKLRKKLVAATGGMDYIETIWGRGYVLADPGLTKVAA